MITAGVDLATEPARTALATVRWSSGRASVLSLSLGVDDADIAEAALSAAKLGLDCPLGWPDDFLRFLQAHQAGRAVAPQEVAGRDWRRRLAYRATDRVVGKERVTRGDVAVLGYKSRAVTPDLMRMTVPMVMNMTGTSPVADPLDGGDVHRD